MFKNKDTDPAKLEAAVRNHIAEAVNKFLGYLDQHKQIEAPAKQTHFKRLWHASKKVG